MTLQPSTLEACQGQPTLSKNGNPASRPFRQQPFNPACLEDQLGLLMPMDASSSHLPPGPVCSVDRAKETSSYAANVKRKAAAGNPPMAAPVLKSLTRTPTLRTHNQHGQGSCSVVTSTSPTPRHHLTSKIYSSPTTNQLGKKHHYGASS